MLLRSSRRKSCVGRDELLKRFDDFRAGNWEGLLVDWPRAKRSSRTGTPNDDMSSRGKRAEVSIRLGEVSRGRHCLTGAPLAPATQDTFEDLQSKRPKSITQPLPEHVLEDPATLLDRLDKDIF
eukprot:9806095-Karenia_brevis.AAC.1